MFSMKVEAAYLLLFLFVELPQGVEDQVGIAERLDRYRKSCSRLLKLETSCGYLHNLPETVLASSAGGFGVHNSSVVEKNAAELRIVRQQECAGELCTFD
jgi:hypothetical protein